MNQEEKNKIKELMCLKINDGSFYKPVECECGHCGGESIDREPDWSAVEKFIIDAIEDRQRDILERVSIDVDALNEFIRDYEKNRLTAGYEAKYRFRGTEFSMQINNPDNKRKILKVKGAI